MEITGFFVSLVGGAIGGNVAGALLRRLSLGSVGDSIAAIVGGGAAAQLLVLLGLAGAAGSSAAGLSGYVAPLAAGVAGGGILLALAGLLRRSVWSLAARRCNRTR